MGDEIQSSRRGRPVLLFCDDDPDDVFIGQRALRRAFPDMDIHVLYDNDEVLAWLKGEAEPFNNRQSHPLPDLIVTDLVTPRRNGYELLKWIRTTKAYCTLPVIIHSGSIVPGEEVRCLEAGATAFVYKDMTCQNLVQTVQRFLSVH
jgi:CheY-like chemotaxis protein